MLPQVHRLLGAIARRAGLPRLPTLHYIPSSMLNAFAVGTPDDAAIGITDGLLRILDLRELAGVLAHEVSHVGNRDLWVMNLADIVSHLTRVMAFLGLLLALTLPLALVQAGSVPWLAVLLLALAPTFGSLLQLALSRAREFDADLDAAGLTGDPVGLASALDEMARHRGGLWERLFLPGARIPDPSLLRTHPPTEDRIQRLLALVPEAEVIPFRQPRRIVVPAAFPAVVAGPRRHLTGLWYRGAARDGAAGIGRPPRVAGRGASRRPRARRPVPRHHMRPGLSERPPEARTERGPRASPSRQWSSRAIRHERNATRATSMMGRGRGRRRRGRLGDREKAPHDRWLAPLLRPSSEPG